MKPVFFQITKVDEEKRLVIGQACAEVPDLSGEIFDYATSKPYFEAWSAKIAEDTGGKSFGNVRSMHSNVAAGKVAEPLYFDDDHKAINITAKVVDNNEWEKVLEGVHTGFSIGGSYVNQWPDGDLTRYTADPSEISLVDRPCIPTAKFFDVVKADGSIIQKAFKEKVMGRQTAVTVDQLTDEMAALLKGGDLNESDMLAAIRKALADKQIDSLVFGKKDYSDDQRKEMAANGEAMSDGSFPIKNGTDLHNAIQAHGRAKDPDAAKEHIKSRAKSLGMEDQLPDDWKDDGKASKVRKSDDPSGAGITNASTDTTGDFGGSGAAQADNMAANTPGGRADTAQASVTMLPTPSVGQTVSLNVAGDDVKGTITSTDDDTVSITTDNGVFQAVPKTDLKAGEPGSGVDFAITGEMKTADKSLSAANLHKGAFLALKKGMYGVGCFSAILADIDWFQRDTEWETEYEGDDSELPANIKAWLAQGAKLLQAYVAEEVGELIGADGAAVQTADMIADDLLFLAAQSGELGKTAAFQYAVTRKMAKRAGTDSAARALEHDVTKKLSTVGAKFEKAVGDAAALRKQLDAKTEELAKAVTARDEALAKARKLEAEARKPALLDVTKQADHFNGAGSEPEKKEEVKDSFGKVDDVASAFKQVHKSGGKRVTL